MSSSLARQALSVVANRWLLAACNFVTFVILARVLTSVEFGAYGVFTSAVFLVEAAGNLGIRQAGAHQIGQKSLSDGQVLGASLMVWPISATVCGLLVWWSMHNVVGTYGGSWLLPSLLATFGVVLASLCQGIFLGRGQIGIFNLIDIFPRLILLLGVLVLSVLGWAGIGEQSWLFAASFVTTAVLGIVLARPAEGERITASFRVLWQLVRQGWPFALALFLILLNARVSIFILSLQLDQAAAGQYFAALRFNDLLLQGAASVGLVLFSHGARSQDPQLALGRAAQATRVMIWGTILIALAGMVLAPVLVPLLLGADYSNSVFALQCLLLALPFATLSRVLSPVLSGLGRPLVGALVLAPAIVLNAGLSYWLSGPYGIAGAAIAMAVTQVMVAAGFVLMTWKVFGRRPGEFVLPRRSDVQDIVGNLRRRLARRAAQKGIDQ